MPGMMMRCSFAARLGIRSNSLEFSGIRASRVANSILTKRAQNNESIHHDESELFAARRWQHLNLCRVNSIGIVNTSRRTRCEMKHAGEFVMGSNELNGKRTARSWMTDSVNLRTILVSGTAWTGCNAIMVLQSGV